MSILSPMLLRQILDGYVLPPRGVHGVTHWARVLENGRRLASLAGGDPEVIALFAVFHDSRRINEAVDHGHGSRGARLARAFRGAGFELDDERLGLLEHACMEHTSGYTAADVTVQVCWDADRLDLLRVGILPHPKFLCTEAAREPDLMEWANMRAARREVPALVRAEWGL